MTKKKKATANREVALKRILCKMPGNNSAIQRARLLAAICELGSITTFEASRYLDIYDPRPRIYELRHDYGHRIVTIMRAEQTESGVFHRVGVYVIRARA